MNVPNIVANSSPFIALERIDQLSLLPALVKQVQIPPAVRQEVFASRPLPGWVVEVAVQQPLGPRMSSVRLGAGEREAIALALEVDATELILDDLPARRLATALNIRVVGTLGLLVRAKRKGLIAAVKPLLEALQSHDFRVSERLFAGVLQAAGESITE